MPKLPIIRPRELIQVLKRLGFYKSNQVGSHAQFKNTDSKIKITVPIHKGKDIKKKTLKGIINDLEISVEEFIKFLKKQKS